MPPSQGITEDAFAVLFLATVSGTWDIATNEWTPRTTTHRIVCFDQEIHSGHSELSEEIAAQFGEE